MRCQHCEREIRRHPSGNWLDSDGLWYCMKPVGGEPLRHTPMPVITLIRSSGREK